MRIPVAVITVFLATAQAGAAQKKGILYNREDGRTEELFDSLVLLLREDMPLSTRTAQLLGLAEARVPGRRTGVLIREARGLLEERRHAQATLMTSGGSPALRQQARPLAVQRLREVSEQNPPGARYTAEMLVPAILSLPGGRETLEGMRARGELRGAVAWVVRANIGGGGDGPRRVPKDGPAAAPGNRL